MTHLPQIVQRLVQDPAFRARFEERPAHTLAVAGCRYLACGVNAHPLLESLPEPPPCCDHVRCARGVGGGIGGSYI